MNSGCYTAIITPFLGETIDYPGFDRLVGFQIDNGITGILAAGTTGESPALSWEEHNGVIQFVADKSKNHCLCIAGTGSNNTAEALDGSRHAVSAGVDALLLVDPYYNGPSSLEIRREYVAPIARAFPQSEIIPYIIPGRTGTQLLPEDLAILHRQFPNVATVKEATGNLDNMRRTRECCGPDFCILSGDDALTCDMMMDSRIAAGGVISVLSNIVPGALVKLVELLKQQHHDAAKELKRALDPLFDLVTVKTTESTPFGNVVCRARNPLAVKTLMTVLGLPSGGCRKPLGKMTQNGLNVVLNAARSVQQHNPELFQPIAKAFDVDIEERLNTPAIWANLVYAGY